MTDFLAVSVNPDLTDEFGHYLAYDRILRKSCRDLSGELISLASFDYASDEEWVRPSFRENSWRLGMRQHREAASRFVEDLTSAVAAIHRPVPIALFTYTGSISHALAVAVVLNDLGYEASALVNLFFSRVMKGKASP